MLVISRKVSESILIGDNIEIILSEISGDKAKICIKAPRSIPIMRKELVETKSLNQEASVHPDQKILENLKDLLKQNNN